MARPRKIQKETTTQYFANVTPLWVPPSSRPIHDRYKDAVNALVEWVGDDWPNNETSYFFPMRHILINSCQSWAAHDWQSDANWIEQRKADAKHLPVLERAFSKFAMALGKAPFQNKKRLLGLAFMAEIYPDMIIGLTHAEQIAAVARAIEWFNQNLKVKDRAYASFGAIGYAGIPRQLPRREVAIALSLADQITFFRRDGLSEGTLLCPHKPSISKNLPWKAIALFASANCGEPLDAATIQTLVTSLARKVAFIHWHANAVKNAESF